MGKTVTNILDITCFLASFLFKDLLGIRKRDENFDGWECKLDMWYK
jgi:hypothetical protein